MSETSAKYCPYCDESRDDKEYGNGKRFFWRKVPVCKSGTTKETVECVAIYCAYCGRTISVIPSYLFFQDKPY